MSRLTPLHAMPKRTKNTLKASLRNARQRRTSSPQFIINLVYPARARPDDLGIVYTSCRWQRHGEPDILCRDVPHRMAKTLMDVINDMHVRDAFCPREFHDDVERRMTTHAREVWPNQGWVRVQPMRDADERARVLRQCMRMNNRHLGEGGAPSPVTEMAPIKATADGSSPMWTGTNALVPGAWTLHDWPTMREAIRMRASDIEADERFRSRSKYVVYSLQE